jgi:hypothetical protein
MFTFLVGSFLVTIPLSAWIAEENEPPLRSLLDAILITAGVAFSFWLAKNLEL